MFTGIVEAVGSIFERKQSGSLTELGVQVGALSEGAKLGQSIALDGCCLTVTRVETGRLWFQAIPESLARTALGEKRVGSRLNIERAMAATDRFEGHIVQGHVDEAGRVIEFRRTGEDLRLHVACSASFGDLLVPKGSVAINGVSLTLVVAETNGLSVALIPHTMGATTLGDLKNGDLVNLEGDVIGKYVRRYVERINPSSIIPT